MRLGLACILYYSNSPFPEGLLRSAITVGMVDCRIPQSGLILGAAHWPHKFQHCTPPILSTCEPFPTMGIPGLLSRILVVASGSHIDGSHGASTALCNPYYRFSRGPWISRGDRQGPKTQSSFSNSSHRVTSLNSWRGLTGFFPHRFPRE